MYSKELEELIESVLADGVVTDQERTVLRKRAQACGEDPDEVMIVVDGRLAKMKKVSTPTTPTTEKRGNIVKCPNCGTPIEAGAVKCAECGYVFTNVKTNNSAERFAKELATVLDKHKNARYNTETAVRDTEIREFIRNFPLPTAKEDMLEFLASLDAKRRNKSDYQSAYAAKYKECATKAKIQFAGDKQVEALLNQTEKFSVSKLTKKQIIIFTIVFLVVGGFGLNSYKVSQAESLCEELCSRIDALPTPNASNYMEVEAELGKIRWTGGDGYFFTGESTYKYRFEDYKKDFESKIRKVKRQNKETNTSSDIEDQVSSMMEDASSRIEDIMSELDD